jgi:hypothetical protein
MAMKLERWLAILLMASIVLLPGLDTPREATFVADRGVTIEVASDFDVIPADPATQRADDFWRIEALSGAEGRGLIGDNDTQCSQWVDCLAPVEAITPFGPAAE